MTDEECEEVNEYHKNLGFEFEIEKEDCKKNPGLRMISKICLNSLWANLVKELIQKVMNLWITIMIC